MEEKREIPVFASGEETATGRFEAIFEPVTGRPTEVPERPVFMSQDGRRAPESPAGRYEVKMMPTMETDEGGYAPLSGSDGTGLARGKKPAAGGRTQQMNVHDIPPPGEKQLVPVGDLSVGPLAHGVDPAARAHHLGRQQEQLVPVGNLDLVAEPEEDTLPLIPDNGRTQKNVTPGKDWSREENNYSTMAERGSFSDLDLGLDTPTHERSMLSTYGRTMHTEQRQVPVFRSGEDTASGPFEARFATATGQPEEIPMDPVFVKGTEAAEGKYEARMLPKGFPPPPQRSAKPAHRATVEDEERPPGGMINNDVTPSFEMPRPLARRSPREVPEVPIFRSGGDSASGKFEAVFAPVTGHPEEIPVEPVFVDGKKAAAGKYEAKMEPEVFEQDKGATGAGAGGLGYLGKPISPEEASAQQVQGGRVIN